MPYAQRLKAVRRGITMKLRAVWVTAIWGLLLFATLGVFELVRDRPRGLDAHNESRAIEHVCAFWKSDTGRFADCGNAYRVYVRCEDDRLRRADGADARKDAEACDNPVYGFRQREQEEVERNGHSMD